MTAAEGCFVHVEKPSAIRHECSVPPRYKRNGWGSLEDVDYGEGTMWQCSTCGRLWYWVLGSPSYLPMWKRLSRRATKRYLFANLKDVRLRCVLDEA